MTSRSPGSAPCATTTTSSSASPTRRWPARGRTAATSCRPPTGSASTTCCCRRATRSASTRPPSPPPSPPTPSSINLLLAVRMGEMWLPQLARQLATIDQMAGGRLNDQHHLLGHARRGAGVGAPLPADPRADGRRCARCSTASASTLTASSSTCTLDPPRAGTVSGHVPADVLRRVLRRRQGRRRRRGRRVPHLAGHGCVGGRARSTRCASAPAAYGRQLAYGLRAHVIVRETEAEAKAAAAAAGVQARRRHRRGDPRQVARRGVGRRPASGGAARGGRPTTASSRRRCGPASAGRAAAPGRRSSAIPIRSLAKLRAYEDAGISAFILSGYTHQAECERFGTPWSSPASTTPAVPLP